MSNKKEENLEKLELEMDYLDSVTGGLANMSNPFSMNAGNFLKTIDDFASYLNKKVVVYKSMSSAGVNSYSKYREGTIVSVDKNMNTATIKCPDIDITVNTTYDRGIKVVPAK